MKILHRRDVRLGGFAGVREWRLVMDPRLFGEEAGEVAWPGLGGCVYLADAGFVPKGETKMHPHKEIDVISVMVAGRITHEGSLEHGQQLETNDVQVQRAGGDGFSHNEVNPDDDENRMIQLWVLPERTGLPAGYRVYRPRPGALTRVYGGPDDQDDTFPSSTRIDIGRHGPGERLEIEEPFLMYVLRGAGKLDATDVADGDLIRSEPAIFEATAEAMFVLVRAHC